MATYGPLPGCENLDPFADGEIGRLDAKSKRKSTAEKKKLKHKKGGAVGAAELDALASRVDTVEALIDFLVGSIGGEVGILADAVLEVHERLAALEVTLSVHKAAEV